MDELPDAEKWVLIPVNDLAEQGLLETFKELLDQAVKDGLAERRIVDGIAQYGAIPPKVMPFQPRRVKTS